MRLINKYWKKFGDVFCYTGSHASQTFGSFSAHYDKIAKNVLGNNVNFELILLQYRLYLFFCSHDAYAEAKKYPRQVLTSGVINGRGVRLEQHKGLQINNQSRSINHVFGTLTMCAQTNKRTDSAFSMPSPIVALVRMAD